jgi:hypothetical protein
LVGSIRVLAALEEHGAGRQLFRLRAWPHLPVLVFGIFAALACVALLGAYEQKWFAVLPLAIGALLVAVFARAECAKAMGSWREVMVDYGRLVETSAETASVASDSPDVQRPQVLHRPARPHHLKEQADSC